eukprot:scaffold421_cov133-Skeletonema_dohrnii-CCMP3373.AAC.1
MMNDWCWSIASTIVFFVLWGWHEAKAKVHRGNASEIRERTADKGTGARASCSSHFNHFNHEADTIRLN